MNVRHVAVAFLALALTGAGAFSTTTAQQQAEARRGPIVGRSVVATTFGIVAASQPLAARAGVQILERGGNAIDAAIAANATIGLMEPTGNGLGGDLFIIYYEAKTGTVHGLNASGWAPTGLTIDFLASKGIKEMPQRGIYSVTVPGVVAGWDEMRDEVRHQAVLGAARARDLLRRERISGVGDHRGRLGQLGEDAERASELAQDVFDRRRARAAGGRNLQESRPRRIAAADRRAGPRRLLQRPDRRCHSRHLTRARRHDDRGGPGEFQPEWVTPIKTTYRGWKVYEIGPQTQGIAALMMLNLMEPYPMAEYGFHSAKALHVMIEAKKLAYADMLRYVGDPRFSRNPVEALLSKPRAIERAKLIDHGQGGVPGRAGEAPRHHRRAGPRHDLHVGDRQGRQHRVADSEQLQRLRIGSGAAGHRLHAAEPRRAVHARARIIPTRSRRASGPLHTIIPAFMEKDEQRIGFGIMGGWNQAQAHAQFVSNIVDYGMTIQEALEAGRFTKGSFEGCDVQIESLVPEKTRAELTARGHSCASCSRAPARSATARR